MKSVLSFVVVLLVGCWSLAVAEYNPYDVMQAQYFSDTCNVGVTDECGTDNDAVNFISNGDYLRYDAVNFGTGAQSVQFSYSNGNTDEHPVTVDFRLGSLTGPSIASVIVGGTNTWCNFNLASSFLSSTPTGVQDLYVVFSSSYYSGASDSALYFNFFQFQATIE